jgi:hypothetical protein
MLGSYWLDKFDNNNLTEREIKNLNNYNWYQEIENKDFLFIRNVEGYWVDFKVNNRYFSYFLKKNKVIELTEDQIKLLAEDVKVVVKF